MLRDSMAAMLRDSIVAVVCTRPRGIPLAMITMSIRASLSGPSDGHLDGLFLATGEFTINKKS